MAVSHLELSENLQTFYEQLLTGLINKSNIGQVHFYNFYFRRTTLYKRNIQHTYSFNLFLFFTDDDLWFLLLDDSYLTTISLTGWSLFNTVNQNWEFHSEIVLQVLFSIYGLQMSAICMIHFQKTKKTFVQVTFLIGVCYWKSLQNIYFGYL